MSFFLPTVALKRVTDISEELLNSLGIRAVFLDVDNTLSTHALSLRLRLGGLGPKSGGTGLPAFYYFE